MADSKKYYYLKIKDNFYESDELILLQNMQDGYLYSDILMKLYLRSLKNNGKLMFKDVIPYTPEALAQVVRHSVGVVKQALDIFQKLGLIEILDNGVIYMTDIQNFIGKSSSEADRIRKYRDEIKKEKNNVQMLQHSYDKSTPEIDIEKDIEKDIDIDLELQQEKEKKIYDFVEQQYGRTLSPLEVQKLNDWLLSFDEEIIKYAIKISILNYKKNLNYVNGILKNWKTQGYKTLQEIKDNENQRSQHHIRELTDEEKEIFEYDWLNDPEFRSDEE